MWKIILSCLIFCFIVIHAKRTTTPSPNFGGTTPPGGNANIEDDPDAECNRKKRCKDRFAVCSNNYCVCKQGFSADPNGKCIKVPALGERCDADKNNILYCQGVGVSPMCPKSGKCECLKGFEPKGKDCVFKDQNLNEKCDGDEDCGVAYSTCQNGKCACGPGFTVDKGKLCKPAYKCPSGDTIQKNGEPQRCEVKPRQENENSDSNAGDNGGCPSNSFCFSNPLVRSSSGGQVGFCCSQGQKIVTPVCPAGDLVKVDQCSSEEDVSDSQQDTPQQDTQNANSCPALTHTCINVAGSAICCPAPCPGQPSFFAFEGRCYETLTPGAACKFDVQCGHVARCDGNSKTCVCKDNFTLVENVCEKQADNN